jgi:hypothetical protein
VTSWIVINNNIAQTVRTVAVMEEVEEGVEEELA